MITTFRLGVTVSVLVLLAACATTGRVGETRYHEADYDIVWAAAIDAVYDIGARIKIESRASGIISATMAVDAIGSAVDLEISVSRSLSGADVQALAVDRHTSEPDEARVEDLRLLERQYLDLVDQAVRHYRQRSRGRPRPF